MLTRDSRTTLRQTGYKDCKRSHRPGGNLVHTQARTDDVIRESIFNSENEMQIVKKTFVTVQQQRFEVWGTYFSGNQTLIVAVVPHQKLVNSPKFGLGVLC